MAYSALRYNASVMRGKDVSTLPSHLDRYLKQTYRDAIRSVDQFVQQIYRDTPEETALLFHSDHGEAFGEHGTYGHQEQLYEENIHVPLLLYDGQTEGRIDQPVSTLEIPTLLAQAAREETAPESATDSVVFSQTEFGDMRAARTPSYKFIRNGDGGELYDLRKSPEEKMRLQTDDAEIFNEVIRAEFAPDAEKSKIVEAVRKAAL